MSMKVELDRVENELEDLYKGVNSNPLLAHRIQELEQRADILADEISEQEEKQKQGLELSRVARREDELYARVSSKNINFRDWWEWAQSLYEVYEHNGEWFVKSHAREWNEEVLWGPYGLKIDAMEKVEELIGYKIQDRNRGHGSMNKDLNGDS